MKKFKKPGSPPQVRGKHFDGTPIYPPERITPAGAGKTFSLICQLPRLQDHPRRCGENITSMLLLPATIGSPPQVRGKLDIDEATGGRIGITPAGAGKTPTLTGFIGAGWDHPRRCGENRMWQELQQGREGSPPQVRGKRKSRQSCLRKRRITPAGAGKTGACCRYRTAEQDHPPGAGKTYPALELIPGR